LKSFFFFARVRHRRSRNLFLPFQEPLFHWIQTHPFFRLFETIAIPSSPGSRRAGPPSRPSSWSLIPLPCSLSIFLTTLQTSRGQNFTLPLPPPHHMTEDFGPYLPPRTRLYSLPGAKNPHHSGALPPTLDFLKIQLAHWDAPNPRNKIGSWSLPLPCAAV